jgi:hypothetical protein
LVQTAIELMRRIYPPHTLIHVGCGRGVGDMHAWRQWDVDTVILIDADPARSQWVASLTAQHPKWRSISSVLGDTDGDAMYYKASNPDQDGLMPVLPLAKLWPNIRELSSENRPTQRLDNLLVQNALGDAIQAPAIIWIIIDCMPAMRILRGSEALLKEASIIWLRVLLEPIQGIDADANLVAINDYLSGFGYCYVQHAEGNHPATGEVIFVRDWAGLHRDTAIRLAQCEHKVQQQQADNNQFVESLRTEAAHQVNILAEYKISLTQITAERDHIQQSVTDLTRQRDDILNQHQQLQRDNGELSHRQQLLNDELMKAEAQIAQQANLIAENQNKLAEITIERDHIQQSVADLTRQRDDILKQHQQLQRDNIDQSQRQQLLDEELSKAEAQIAQQVNIIAEHQYKLAQVTNERDHLQQSVDDLTRQRDDILNQNQQLQRENLEQGQRQKLLDEELIKASAQIDLIKDLLLHGSEV